MHSRHVDRREFFGIAAAGAAFAMVGDVFAESPGPRAVRDVYYESLRRRLQAAGATANPSGLLRTLMACRYRTDPEPIARILPPHLEPDESPEVLLNWLMTVSRPDEFMAFLPYWTYAEADMMVSASFQGHRCMVPVALLLEHDFGRYTGREDRMLRMKEGLVNIDVHGNRVRAWASRRGSLVSAIETEITNEPSHPMYWVRETGWGWMRADYRLNPDWRKGLIDGDEVHIWRHLGFDEGYPTGLPDAKDWERAPMACDVTATKVALGNDPLTPFGEFPVREILGVSFGFATIDNRNIRDPIEVPRGPEKRLLTHFHNTGRQLVEVIPAKDYEPWAFFGKGYDRPVTRNRVWVPTGWKEKSSAVVLTPEEIARWKSREFLELEPVHLVDIHLEVDRATHASTLPPPCDPGGQPMIRIVGARVTTSDLSTRPFTELWLLSRCVLEDRPSWFALSHIISFEGDMLFGRETFGYPTKVGDPEITVHPLQVDILGRRFGRDFLLATVPLTFDEPRAFVDRLDVIGLRRSPKDVEPTLRYISQPRTLSIEKARRARPEDVVLTFPDAPGPGRIGTNEPWFDFKNAKVLDVVSGRGVERRFPGRVLESATDGIDIKYLEDRMDGLTGRSPQAGSFLIGDGGGH